jgi:hypothetical protein
VAVLPGHNKLGEDITVFEPKPVQDCALDCGLIRQNKIQAIKSMLVLFMGVRDED